MHGWVNYIMFELQLFTGSGRAPNPHKIGKQCSQATSYDSDSSFETRQGLELLLYLRFQLPLSELFSNLTVRPSTAANYNNLPAKCSLICTCVPAHS